MDMSGRHRLNSIILIEAPSSCGAHNASNQSGRLLPGGDQFDAPILRASFELASVATKSVLPKPCGISRSARNPLLSEISHYSLPCLWET
jgi:hypothetical protein